MHSSNIYIACCSLLRMLVGFDFQQVSHFTITDISIPECRSCPAKFISSFYFATATSLYIGYAMMMNLRYY